MAFVEVQSQHFSIPKYALGHNDYVLVKSGISWD